MNKEILISKLVSNKADNNNIIDLDAYARGLDDMYEELTTVETTTSGYSFVVDVNKEKFIDELLDRLYINGSKEGGNFTLTLSQATTAANEVWDEFMKQK